MTKLRTFEPPRPATPVPQSELFAQRALDITDDDDRGYLRGTTAMGAMSSEEGWKNYERIGEVRYAISRSARIAGYATLHAEYMSPGGDIVERVEERGVVAEEVAKMYGKFGGTRGLVERFYTCMKVPGEAYPIWVRERDMVDGMWMLSPSEIDQSSIESGRVTTARPIKWITGRMQSAEGKTNFTRRVQPEDFIGRIWTPSKRYTDETDSPMLALNSQCEMLHTLTQSIMGRLRQRFALAGLLLIPNEINDAAVNTQVRPNVYSNDKVMNYLITIMTTNVANHELGMSQMPALLKGPQDALDKVRHILLDTSIADTDIRLRAELINRILDGLDQQKQAATGGTDTNHWGMWAVSDEERRITVQPDLESLCYALTKMVLWRRLKERGWTDGAIRRWRVGYDLSRAAVKTNVAEDARQAHDRGIVNADFVRRSIGATDDDAMDNDEYVRWVGNRMTDPVLATYGLEGVEVATLPVRASESTPGPTADSPADEAPVGPGVGDPGSPNDRDSDAPRSEEPG